MKLNKKYFLAIFTVLGMQVFLGINLANAVCENEIENFCRTVETTQNKDVNEWSLFIPYSKCKTHFKEEWDFSKSPMSVQEVKDAIEYELPYTTGQWANNKSIPTLKSKTQLCLYRAQLEFLTNKSGQPTTGGKGQQEPAGNQSNSGTSSSQTNSPQPTAQSENTQTNTSQQTTTSKKGKKNPNDVPAKCVKFNHDKTKIVNMCNFPINFSFCMLHQDDQTIQVANSCNDGFVAETVYPGRAISDESLDTRFFGIACKFPSKPINVRYISYSEPLEGNCPR